MRIAAETARRFAAAFGAAPTHIAAAPGRVNLIGEHTDYNDGFVMPMAIDRHTVVAARTNGTARLRIVAATLDDAQWDHHAGALPTDDTPGWARYVAGAAALLVEAGAVPAGMDLLIDSDLPAGMGLSSSAALELASLWVLAAAWGHPLDRTAAALMGQAVEHRFAGVRCGIMDQLVIARAEAGAALQIDCRTLAATPQPLGRGVTVLIADSGVTRGLKTSAYNDRRAACEAAASAMGVAALRDADLDRLAAASMDPTTRARARHVITEHARVPAMAAALASGRIDRAGAILRESHASMRDDFAITVPAVDRLAAIANAAIGPDGGARMTGGGFGGFVVAIVPLGRAEAVETAIVERYRTPDGQPTAVWRCTPVAGVALVEPSRFA